MHTFEKFCSACGVKICSVSLDREATFLALPPPPHTHKHIQTHIHTHAQMSIRNPQPSMVPVGDADNTGHRPQRPPPPPRPLTKLKVSLQQQAPLLHLLRVEMKELLRREAGQGARAKHPFQLVVQTAQLAIAHHTVQLAVRVDSVPLSAQEVSSSDI